MDPPSPLSDGGTANQQPVQSATSLASGNQQSGGPRFSNGLHIRSRITVVCAECKRLKLKCDRRTPCGSCVKRDTVHRCQYSAAAAEKIDVQSLHNRLQIVESQMAQMIAGGVRGPAALGGSPADNLPFPHNDRAMLVTGNSGSSVTISLDEVASLWLEHIDLPQSSASDSSPPSPFAHAPSTPQVKLESTPSDLSVLDDTAYPSSLPPLSIYYPHGSPIATISSTLIALLPAAPSLRSRIATSIEETMRMHPCFNVKQFRSRAESMFCWAKEEDARPSSTGAGNNTKADMKDLAKAIFFPSPSSSVPPSPVASPPRPSPTLSFFASVAAAYALGVQACKENEAATSEAEAQKGGSSSKSARLDDGSKPSPCSHKPPAWHKTSAAGLYALSRQALAAFEMTHTYDLDYLVACILQLLFLLHDGRQRIAHTVYPLVGKMVNIATMMGLATDPDEFPGKYTLFEAEQRRRIWWDVYYYDVFVADCVGQAPTIQDNSYTTKMPADVDEEQFVPSSTSLPVPVPRRAGGDPTEVGFAYFTQKCRLAMLLKAVKKRSFKDPLNLDSSEPSLEQAEQFEAEVKSWLSELPRAFRLESAFDTPSSSSAASTSPYLQAQRCELAIVANRLILKVFLPFLKNCSEPSSDIIPRRVVSSVVDAGHAIIHAVRLIHTTWRQTRPAAFAFYSFGRTLFDASVMAACAVIVHPTGASSGVALADLSTALDIMRDTQTAAERSKQSLNGAGEVSEAVKVVEMLKAKAESTRQGDIVVPSPSFHSGTKRKRGEADPASLTDGFQLPYVGPSVTVARTTPQVVTLVEAPSSSRPPTSSGSKVRVKQRESSVVPDLSGGFETSTPIPADKSLKESLKESLLKGQVPTRGRPRQTSSVRHRNAPTNSHKRQMAAPPPPMPPVLTVPSQGGTPAPENSSLHPLPDLTLGELPSQTPMEYNIVPFSPAESRRFSTVETDIGTPHMQPQAALQTPTSSGYDPSPQMPQYCNADVGRPQSQSMQDGMFAGMGGGSAHSTPSYSAQSPYSTLNQDFFSVPSFNHQQGGQIPGYDHSLVGLGMSCSDSRPHTSAGPPQDEAVYMMGGSDSRLMDPRMSNLAASIPTRRNDITPSWSQGNMGGQQIPGSGGDAWPPEYNKYF